MYPTDTPWPNQVVPPEGVIPDRLVSQDPNLFADDEDLDAEMEAFDGNES